MGCFPLHRDEHLRRRMWRVTITVITRYRMLHDRPILSPRIGLSAAISSSSILLQTGFASLSFSSILHRLSIDSDLPERLTTARISPALKKNALSAHDIILFSPSPPTPYSLLIFEVNSVDRLRFCSQLPTRHGSPSLIRNSPKARRE